MSISSVFQIIQLIVPAIQTAEEFIRGRGKGKEKKEAVLANLLAQISRLRKEIGETASLDTKSFNWIRFALSSPEFLQKVSVLVDSIVDLANFLQSFDNPPDEKPEVIN